MSEPTTLRGHLIRSYNVMVLGIAYLMFGLPVSYFINRVSPVASTSESTGRLIFEIAAEVGVTILCSYIIHRLIERMPLPMIGTEQEKKQIIEQVRGGIVIAFAMFTLQLKLRNKIQYLFYGKIEDLNLVSLDG